ncbi:hypothetical protein [Vibrio sp. ECSMB14106]|uniref:hypothetical protein n=1 Tax=Vibrio sp. ECSMB14106 TaxID=1638949 RepID=UPI00061934A7|nr:hypothetical protein [Vibrio sp. ECSMB14106]
MVLKKILLSCLFVSLTGCVGTKFNDSEALIAQSDATVVSGYTYIPMDPFAVKVDKSDNSKVNCNLLSSLPDNAVRMSVESFAANGNVSYAASGLGVKGERYRVTVDYVNSDTTNFAIRIRKTAYNKQLRINEFVHPLEILNTEVYEPKSVSYIIVSGESLARLDESEKEKNKSFPFSWMNKTEMKITPNDADESEISAKDKYVDYNVPVYVGIGLRVTANIQVLASTSNISGLGVIGIEAESNALQGALVVQTLGINGKSVSAALPIQSELNRTTAQNSIVAVGQIKTLLYDEETIKSPRIVGIYLPFEGSKKLVNAIISEISKSDNLVWKQKCPSMVK